MDALKKKIIAIDFDGVIHKYSCGWSSGNIYDCPIDGALEALLKLVKNYEVVIFTTRESREAIQNWFKSWANSYKLNEMELKTLLELPITNIKPLAFAFIDDRAIRFTNWKDILNYF